MIYVHSSASVEADIDDGDLLARYARLEAAQAVPAPDADHLTWWGSDCDACGNATHGSMTCDNCGSDEHTRPLWRDNR